MGCNKEAFAALWESSSRHRLDMTCDDPPPSGHLESPGPLLTEILCDMELDPVERETLSALLRPSLCDEEGSRWRNIGSCCET